MEHAIYREMEGGTRYFFELPDLQGVWADAATIEEGRAELQEVLADWIAIGLSLHQNFPIPDGIDINLEHATSAGR